MPRGKILPAPAFKFLSKPPVPVDAFRKDLSPTRHSPYREALRRAFEERTVIETEKRAYDPDRLTHNGQCLVRVARPRVGDHSEACRE